MPLLAVFSHDPGAAPQGVEVRKRITGPIVRVSWYIDDGLVAELGSALPGPVAVFTGTDPWSQASAFAADLRAMRLLDTNQDGSLTASDLDLDGDGTATAAERITWFTQLRNLLGV